MWPCCFVFFFFPQSWETLFLSVSICSCLECRWLACLVSIVLVLIPYVCHIAALPPFPLPAKPPSPTLLLLSYLREIGSFHCEFCTPRGQIHRLHTHFCSTTYLSPSLLTSIPSLSLCGGDGTLQLELILAATVLQQHRASKISVCNMCSIP